MNNAKIGIFEYEDGSCDVHIVFNGLFFEFGTQSKREAEEVINAIKNAEVATNPLDEFWESE